MKIIQSAICLVVLFASSLFASNMPKEFTINVPMKQKDYRHEYQTQDPNEWQQRIEVKEDNGRTYWQMYQIEDLSIIGKKKYKKVGDSHELY